jgi:hypothetical protein
LILKLSYASRAPALRPGEAVPGDKHQKAEAKMINKKKENLCSFAEIQNIVP